MIPLLIFVDMITKKRKVLLRTRTTGDLASGQGVISQKTHGYFSLSEQPGKHIGIPAAVKHATVKQTTTAISGNWPLKGLEIDPSLTSFVSDCVSYASAIFGQTELPLLSLGETP